MKLKRLVVSSFQTNCYVIYDEHSAIIIDPGDQAKKIKGFISDNELNVLAILLTHGHCDHISAVDSLYQTYQCPVYLNKEDFPYLTQTKYNLSTMLGQELIIHAPVLESMTSFEIGPFMIKWHHLPGHTPGSSMIEFVNEKIIFSGDVLFNGSIGRFDFPLSSRHDTLESMKKIAAFDYDAQVYPGHGEATTINQEKENNPYLNM